MLPSFEQLIDQVVQVKQASVSLLYRLLLSIIVVITATAMLSLVLEVA